MISYFKGTVARFGLTNSGTAQKEISRSDLKILCCSSDFKLALVRPWCFKETDRQAGQQTEQVFPFPIALLLFFQFFYVKAANGRGQQRYLKI
jgi:hypothetical protein